MTMLRFSGGKRTSGLLFGTDWDGKEHNDGETLSCVHCQYIWTVKPLSGNKRGFCMRCNGPTCGKKQCMEKCVPFEKAIEEMEARGRLLERVEKEQAEWRSAPRS